MRTLHRVAYLVCFMLITGISVSALAQSSQYKRAKTKKASSKSKKKSEKLDITDLEKQYWAPKDKEFSVVQNRKFSKEKRIGVSLQMGPIINDPYSKGNANTSLSVSYYWKEKQGAEFNYMVFGLDNSKLVNAFGNQFGGTIPNFNRQKSYVGFNYNWVPIYGKMSVMDKRIIYYDFAISPGLGMMKYEHIDRYNRGGDKSTLALNIDISQHFFIHKNFALRLDVKNRFYNEDILDWNSGAKVKDDDNLTTVVVFGFTYYH